MATAEYDIITIGGGMGGAALARSMAERGARVLVLGRETKFKDRVRGEGMAVWGAGEARALGIYDLIVSSCGHELPYWDNYAGPVRFVHHRLVSTTPQGLPMLAFYHPEMQETLLSAAAQAGAEVRRGVRAKGVTPGATPRVALESNGRTEEVQARLAVGADGRASMARTWAGFTEKRDPDRLLISGLLFENSSVSQDAVRLISDFSRGRGVFVFPNGAMRVRTYLVYSAGEGMRLQGKKDIPRFIQESIDSGLPAEHLEGARPAGPLATFEGAGRWVDHPYRDGIALIGDAAGCSDPSWGQGMSLTLRDARVLRDALLANDDWDAAGHTYASQHDQYFGVIHAVEGWMTELFYETGPDADARRTRSFSLMARELERLPDAFIGGPETTTVSERTKRRFFGEE